MFAPIHVDAAADPARSAELRELRMRWAPSIRGVLRRAGSGIGKRLLIR